MKKDYYFRGFSAVLLALALTACSEHQATAPPIATVQAPAATVAAAPAAAPVIVQAAPQQSGMQDMLVGGAIGALATHALSGPSRQAAVATPVVHNTTIVQKTVVVKPATATPIAPPAPAASFVRQPAPVVAAKAMPSYSPPATSAPASYKVSYSMPSSSGKRR